MNLELKKLKKKLVTRKSHFKFSEDLLLETIFTLKGGPKKLSKLWKCTLEAVINWKRRGYVPLKKVVSAAKTLGVPREVLNYKEVDSYGSEVLSFKSAVKKVDFIPSEVKVHILKLPRRFK